VATLCGDDGPCYEAVRLEILDGTDRTPKISVTLENSALNRLSKLLLHLAAQFPGEHWGDFILPGGLPDLSRTIVAGHSLGGGEAAIVCMNTGCARAVLFSAVIDSVGSPPQPAPWLTVAPLTPSSSFFGFVHTADPAVGAIEASWGALALPGSLTSVDGAAPPYAGSQRLTTSLSVSMPHLATAIDAETPMAADGTPVYTPAWTTLIGP
jgi:hypothetical protein